MPRPHLALKQPHPPHRLILTALINARVSLDAHPWMGGDRDVRARDSEVVGGLTARVIGLAQALPRYSQ